VDDVATTANHYRDKLGFQYERFWGEPPCFCMVYRNVIVIMLRQVSAKGVMRPNHIADPSQMLTGTHTFGSMMLMRFMASLPLRA